MQKQLTEELDKYYKRVLTCKECGQVYGSDLTDKKENGKCPFCQYKFTDKYVRLKRLIDHDKI